MLKNISQVIIHVYKLACLIVKKDKANIIEYSKNSLVLGQWLFRNYLKIVPAKIHIFQDNIKFQTHFSPKDCTHTVFFILFASLHQNYTKIIYMYFKKYDKDFYSCTLHAFWSYLQLLQSMLKMAQCLF